MILRHGFEKGVSLGIENKCITFHDSRILLAPNDHDVCFQS